MRGMSFALSCLTVLATSAAALGAEPTFTEKPTAVKSGAGMRVSFAVSAPTNVEVAVLDAQGKVVRHLAAGMLGPNPPPPLRPNTLRQEIEWDGEDDAGADVQGAEVRVRLGLRGRFDGFLLYNPAASGPIAALAAGPNGAVYLFHHDPTTLPSHWGSKKIKVLDRDGRHVRAVTPFPAGIDPEKIKPLTPFRDESGRLVPHIHHLRQLSVYPEAANAFPPYQSPVVDRQGRAHWLVLGPAVASIAADGSVPYDTLVGPRLLPDVKDLRTGNLYMYSLDAPCLALSGDEKSLYLAGLWTGKFEKKDTYAPLPAVFRVDLDKRGPGEVFVGRLDARDTQGALLAAPRGLAVANGLLYIADTQADRVAVFREADRSYVGQIKVANPQSIGVDPATGAVYVCAYTGKQTADLIKFDGYANGRQVARIALPKTGLDPNGGVHRIAVDASARPVLIYVPDLPYSTCRLNCLEDAGAEFKDRGDPRDLTTPWAEGPRDLTLDRLRGELYVKSTNQRWYRIDEPTGKLRDVVDLNKVYKYNLYMSDNGTQLVPSPDGSLITLNWNRGLIRLDRSGKPLNWPGRDTDQIPFGGIMNFMQRVLAVPRADELYVVLPNTYRIADPKEKEKVKSRAHSVDVLGVDGQPKRTVVWQCTHGTILRVDAKGNIYLAEPIKPVGRFYPEFFDGKLANPTRNLTPAEGRYVFWNSYMYGSIVKFPPSGGAIWYNDDRTSAPSAVGQPPADLLAKPVVKAEAHLVYQIKAPAEIQGADWFRFGFAPYSMHSGSDTCMCEGAGFDIDLYGRVFYPNLGQFRVEMVDAANHLLGAFGQYGNQDDDPEIQNPESRIQDTSNIPLAWPLTVAVSDTHAYVADTVSRRVVKVRLDCAASETCTVKP
jgi:DNA-binding beta-propeller fold protein YncE